MTSSLGRLFDAVAFLLGLADTNHHEAQAAMALEAAARMATSHAALTFSIQNAEDSDSGPLQLDVRPTILEILAGRRGGQDAATMAWAFHATIAAGLAEAASKLARRHKLERVVLSGGCFANRLLLGLLEQQLGSFGLTVYSHRLVPTGDGGVSLGQAVCAAGRMAEI
jgi:hydrogenase maturation protein HypF